jgi:hypothetical protein
MDLPGDVDLIEEVLPTKFGEGLPGMEVHVVG